MNRVTLIGNLGNDPEIRAMQNGKEVVNFTVATSEKWKDKATGEKKEATEWHRICIFNPGLVEVCKNYLNKGQKVLIEGAVKTRKWQDQDGNDKYTTEIVLSGFDSKLLMLGGKSEGAQQQPQSTAPAMGASYDPQKDQKNHGAPPPADDFEDEIPFN